MIQAFFSCAGFQDDARWPSTTPSKYSDSNITIFSTGREAGGKIINDFPPAGEAGGKIIDDFPPAGEAGEKIINDFPPRHSREISKARMSILESLAEAPR